VIILENPLYRLCQDETKAFCVMGFEMNQEEAGGPSIFIH